MPTIREAVALFDDSGQLERAVSDLQGVGFDRADISFLTHRSVEQTPDDSRHLAESFSTPREAPVTETDIRQLRALRTSMAATIAAFAAAGFAVATGGATALVAVAAVVAGGGVGAVGVLAGAKFGDAEIAHFEEQLAPGGALLWLHLGAPDAEVRAMKVLRHYSSLVEIHEFAAAPHQTLPSDGA